MFAVTKKTGPLKWLKYFFANNITPCISNFFQKNANIKLFSILHCTVVSFKWWSWSSSLQIKPHGLLYAYGWLYQVSLESIIYEIATWCEKGVHVHSSRIKILTIGNRKKCFLYEVFTRWEVFQFFALQFVHCCRYWLWGWQ